jgi:hypothetical protein
MMSENATATPEAAAKPAPVLVFDGTEYPIDQLSEGARAQLANLRGCELEIGRLKQQLAIAQTARAAYLNALKQSLPPQA